MLTGTHVARLVDAVVGHHHVGRVLAQHADLFAAAHRAQQMVGQARAAGVQLGVAQARVAVDDGGALGEPERAAVHEVAQRDTADAALVLGGGLVDHRGCLLEVCVGRRCF
jgi:hypothetical protein